VFLFKRFILVSLALAGAFLIVAAGMANAAPATEHGAPPRPGFTPNRSSVRTPPSPRVDAEQQPQPEEENGASDANGGSSDYMYYRGGWVQESPQIYIVYWGDWSLATDRYDVRSRLWYFLAGVGGSQWARTLGGYGYNCTIGGLDCPRGTMITNPSGQLRAGWIDSSYVPWTPTKADLDAEAQRAAAHWGVYSHNAQFFIALPPGHGDYRFVGKSATPVCAWHNLASVPYGDRAVAYTSFSYMPDAGTTCGAYSVTGSILDGVSLLASHEYAETVTNPYINVSEGWDDSTFGNGEIGDKCNWGGGPAYRRLVTFSTGNFPVQALWSNYARWYTGWGCVFGS
jgi:hypothetical protein